MDTGVAERSIDGDDQLLAGDRCRQKIEGGVGQKGTETLVAKDAEILPQYPQDLQVHPVEGIAMTDPEDDLVHPKIVEEIVPQEIEITTAGRGEIHLLPVRDHLLQKDGDHLIDVNHTLVETQEEVVRMGVADMTIVEMGAMIGEKTVVLHHRHEKHRMKTRRLNGNGSWLPCNKMPQV